jgi:hypothetical protein
MKTKFYWFALLASAALIAQAQAGGHHGGGGATFAAPVGPARAAAPSFGSASAQSFGGGRMIYSGQRFSPAFRQPYINSNGRGFSGARQFTPGNINRGDRIARFSNGENRGGNRAVTNPKRDGNSAGQVRGGNNLPTNWRNHVVAQHSATWRRDWDRSRDHWWHGHHCRFVNGSWFIFDAGFDPWWPYWFDYYAYDYYAYPYDYDTADYDQKGYADQYADSTVAAAQQRLAQQGYYRGAIDGVFGPETRRAVSRYQGNHGLRVTGNLTTDTLQALGLQRVASN